ncbi:unnamed protein product [Mesocestoides corti]|uniref:Uncharacterized protein n=1 Tax=Mesocestoides corti TaxID=53468 RepID=A0A0R3UCF0_MESCO|nr:unnamed protein product [Mesocestoides corti]
MYYIMCRTCFAKKIYNPHSIKTGQYTVHYGPTSTLGDEDSQQAIEATSRHCTLPIQGTTNAPLLIRSQSANTHGKPTRLHHRVQNQASASPPISQHCIHIQLGRVVPLVTWEGDAARFTDSGHETRSGLEHNPHR